LYIYELPLSLAGENDNCTCGDGKACGVRGYNTTISNGIYYVNATNGNDLNSGNSFQEPFATITRALANVIDGDTIILNNEIYDATTESLPFIIDKPITFKGLGRQVTKIIYQISDQSLFRVVVDDCSFVKFMDFEVDSSSGSSTLVVHNSFSSKPIIIKLIFIIIITITILFFIL